ncbi:MAG: DoxX family protein [Nitrosopumilus sp.]|nr:DoxX family protein [Nitrosopumilus sp.]MDH3823032.1 DoxX family protein [Nitrosopumilus sp.]MDH3834159.1 DoxX family protein [Nitrosopumilus sp.]
MYEFKNTNASELAFLGLRASIGILFVTVGLGKFNESFVDYLMNVGLPVELQIPLALAEVLGGIMLMIGFLTRVSGSILSGILIGAIIIKQISMPFEIASIETDLIILSGCILILVTGSGKISLIRKIRKIPKILN